MKILVVEDEKKTALAIRDGLTAFHHEVIISYDGEDALKRILREAYDLIICDVLIPHKTGFELVDELRKNDIHLPVIFLTALDQNDEKIRGFDVGADDYLTKPFAFNELLARINAVSRRFNDHKVRKSILRFSDIVLDTDTRIVKRKDKEIELTPKEFDLLAYLIENQNKVVSKKEIAEKVWKINFETGTNTIEVYVNYLRNKIDKPFKQKLIHTSHGVGYMLKES